MRRAFLLATFALSVAIGIACPKAGHPHQLTRVSILPASTPIQMVIPAGSPTDCLGRFNPFESFSDPNGFGKFLNNCFRPDFYVHGFVDGMASCFSSAFIIKTKEVVWSSDGNLISKWEISENDQTFSILQMLRQNYAHRQTDGSSPT